MNIQCLTSNTRKKFNWLSGELFFVKHRKTYGETCNTFSKLKYKYKHFYDFLS